MIAGFEEKPAPPPTPEAKTDTRPTSSLHESWIYRHPLSAAIIGIGGLIVLGGIIVIQRADVRPSESSGAWGGAGGAFFGTIRNATSLRNSTEDVIRLQSPQDNYATIPIFDTSPLREEGEDPYSEDFAALLTLLVRPQGGADAEENPEGYAFIPQGLVSTEAQIAKRTPLQEELFVFGNTLGSNVKNFYDTHPSGALIMKDHIEDRTNPEKVTAVRHFGIDMAQLGVDIQSIQIIPKPAQALHKAYGATYRLVGSNLVKVAEAKTDEELLDAIAAYNASVEELSKRFVALVDLFASYQVTFGSVDQGNVFVFSTKFGL